MIKGILFDLDGTLLDREASVQSFVSGQYERFEPLQVLDKEAYMRRFIELDSHGYVWKDVVYQQLVEENRHRLSPNVQWEQLLDDYVTQFANHCIGFDYLHETLQELRQRKMKLGIITNGFGDFQARNIEALGIADYFDVIVISQLEGVRKPDAEIFRRALERLGLEPGEAAFVGDHPENDIRASMKAGMRGVWKEDHYYDSEFDRDFTIRQLNELLAMESGH